MYLEFISTIEVAIIVENDFDNYEYTDNSFYFCKSYYNMIVKEKIPKFGSANYINILPYQKYPNVLNNLTRIKEIFIAFVHPIILIINLRPSNFSFSTLYYQI